MSSYLMVAALFLPLPFISPISPSLSLPLLITATLTLKEEASWTAAQTSACDMRAEENGSEGFGARANRNGKVKEVYLQGQNINIFFENCQQTALKEKTNCMNRRDKSCSFSNFLLPSTVTFAAPKASNASQNLP